MYLVRIMSPYEDGEAGMLIRSLTGNVTVISAMVTIDISGQLDVDPDASV